MEPRMWCVSSCVWSSIWQSKQLSNLWTRLELLETHRTCLVDIWDVFNTVKNEWGLGLWIQHTGWASEPLSPELMIYQFNYNFQIFFEMGDLIMLSRLAWTSRIKQSSCLSFPRSWECRHMPSCQVSSFVILRENSGFDSKGIASWILRCTTCRVTYLREVENRLVFLFDFTLKVYRVAH